MTDTLPTGLYRHFKGGLYEMTLVATDSTNGRGGVQMVVYRNVLGGEWKCRRRSEFGESVEKDGEQVPRFKLVEEMAREAMR